MRFVSEYYIYNFIMRKIYHVHRSVIINIAKTNKLNSKITRFKKRWTKQETLYNN